MSGLNLASECLCWAWDLVAGGGPEAGDLRLGAGAEGLELVAETGVLGLGAEG